ncbi:SRPBCC family protein [Nesterenkonia muleiensis]|uniref:SRPBCC family protein n=1 Tax=Nesterenkonia muleiensis TaxID=2282648 RepID=UPI000E7733C2|nr:SRPBCC family protein [Nesterenkonia muleiensis]
MPITSVDKDLENLTMTIVADFPVPVRRLWDAYVDPRQIEKFWGPEGWPATFIRHEVHPGGRSRYYMTGPEGERSHGWWEFLSVEEGKSFEVADGFADENGEPNPAMPTMRMIFRFEETESGSRLVTTTYFNSLEELEQLLGMGMEEGLRSAMGQIDDVLADLTSFAAARATEAQLLSDTQVRISRTIRGSVQQVWDAHHDPEQLKRWLLGPAGWQFTDCQVANAAGQTYRYAWADANGENGFALTGEVVESQPPYREVTTESMEDVEGPATLNEQTLTPVDDGTLLSLVITYDSKEQRDAILATGMTDGMEASYARLESAVLAAV